MKGHSNAESSLTEPTNTPDDPQNLKDLVLELNFVPRWARTPPENGRFSEHEPRHERVERDERRPFRRPQSDSRDRGQRDRRPERRDRDQGGARPDRKREFDAPRPADRGDQGDRSQRPPPRDAANRPAPPPRLPLRVSMIPDQRQLAAMLHQLHVARKAYPVADLASLLCAKPEFCCARIEVERDAPGAELYQCKTCRAVARDRASILFHAVHAHMDEYFDKVIAESEPPTGQFTCVARCGLSGVLLGPPNHHSYGERVQEVHRTRYPEMSMDAYRSRIEMSHDAALIEQWKEESRKTTTYKLKSPANEEEAKALPWSAAEALFQRRFAPAIVSHVQRAVLPVSVAMKGADATLVRVVRDAWQRECRFPRNMVFALRAVFRHKKLHLFKVGEGWDYVCPIRPVPLDPQYVIPSIREVLTHLQSHPGCKRKELLEALRPGAAEGAPEVSEVLSPLGWLIEKGHILEFFDGSLSVPLSARPQQEEPTPAAPAEP
jgi:hypothetical protein